MLNSPTKSLLKDADLHHFTESISQKKGPQHGIQLRNIFVPFPILLDVPAETLTCITSYLEPPTLLSVAQVNIYLNRHINDENTWRRAFICQFLGIGPQLDFNHKHTLLLRRSETSWRNEFIVRYRLRRRWERSRNGSITHIPVHSTISGMHQMANGLLTSSLEYGIVARSIPLTGKILSGYLDASGSAAGLGVGNPNAEFTPNISACAMASDGGTAKLVWGSRIGDVLFMSIPKAMDTGRRGGAEVRRCSVIDEHEGAVVDVVWLTVQPGWVITGGADGRVKVWDAKNATSVWTSQQVFDSVIPDCCVKVTGSTQHGFVVVVFKSGQIRIWSGFDFYQPTLLVDNIKEIVVECPIRTSADGYDSSANHDVKTLHHDSHRSVLVGYENDCYFYRIQVDPSTFDVQTLAFGEPHSGSLSTIVPLFRTNDMGSSIIFTGDHLGCISLYEWDTDPSNPNPQTNAVGPLKKFEAHVDGAGVTSIAWNGLVLVTGSVRGDAHVFDGMTFELLRSFESPHPRFGRRLVGTDVGEMERQRREAEKVRIILLGPEKDVVFMGVGNKVVAWKAGPIPRYFRSGVRGRNVSGWARGKRPGQGVKNLDYLTQDIIESQDIMEDEAVFSARTQRARGREHDQQEGLATLGLSEVEAVEYVLMLSRDEANQHGRHQSGPAASSRAAMDEGVFEGDFDDDGQEDSLDDGDSGILVGNLGPDAPSMPASKPPIVNNAYNTPYIVSSPSSGSSPSFSGRSGRSIPGAARIMTSPRFSPSSHSSSSSTNTKIHISPPYRAEPLEAGAEWRGGDDRGEEGEMQGTRLGLEDHYFPAIGNTGMEGKIVDDAIDSRPETPSPKSNKKWSSVPSGSAWSTPLTKKLSFSLSNKVNMADRVPDRNVPSSSSTRPTWSSAPAVASGSARVSPPMNRAFIGVDDQDGNEVDDDLRFALELSLAEAKSSEDV